MLKRARAAASRLFPNRIERARRGLLNNFFFVASLLLLLSFFPPVSDLQSTGRFALLYSACLTFYGRSRTRTDPWDSVKDSFFFLNDIGSALMFRFIVGIL